MDHTKELTHISLCAGYGGIDLGLARALGAVRTVAFVEIEAFAAENLVAKVEAGHLDPLRAVSALKDRLHLETEDLVSIAMRRT